MKDQWRRVDEPNGGIGGEDRGDDGHK